MDEVRLGAIITSITAVAGGLYKFIQWLVTTALSTAEKATDRLEDEVSRAHEAAREARLEMLQIRLTLDEIERENANLRAENRVLLSRIEILEMRNLNEH